MKALVPLSLDDLGGAAVTMDDGYFDILAHREKIYFIEFHSFSHEFTWFEHFDLMYCQLQHDSETLKVIRKATDEERRVYRIPLWIQGEEVPECCGKPMFFVGQIDDNFICTERSDDAKMWWHDDASFYVFTCPICLEVKAVGQQF